jgi:uncharacterized protein YyaL (SSP411 family)
MWLGYRRCGYSPAMPNRLSDESSPYLRQHGTNPVDWYPWGPEALDRARAEKKPILLSIGYSACHWCHVMAHESFADEDTAAIMNRAFINIKVDREERPDLDKIYQTAHQLLTQRPGGWPLTMFLSHDGQWPFFGGTYFPPEPRYGMPGFRDILERAADYYQNNAGEVAKQSDAFAEAFARLNPPASSEPLTDEPLVMARAVLAEQFDRDNGGFGGTPKFPSSTNIERLLRHWRASASAADPDLDALYMATLTLTRMAQGGLQDQLGGGFFRYSVDQHWLIPHFEKMLYDNALLLGLYAQAYGATGENLFAEVARDTANWLLTDMRADNGGFFATLDADSEGAEGRLYLWTPAEAEKILPAKQFQIISRHWGLSGPANFQDTRWHLFVAEPLDRTASALGLSAPAAATAVDDARRTLLTARRQRAWPGRDEKVLTGWNGLTIRALAIAAQKLNDPALISIATEAADCIHQQLWSSEQGLRATLMDGRARFSAYLDDYAFVADGLLELLQCRWRAQDFELLQALVETMLDSFADTREGGFFFTAHDHEPLILRPRSFADDATPSGNGVAATVLIRLGYLLGETRYLEFAQRTLQAGWLAMLEYPQAHGSLLNALEEYLNPPHVIIIRGGDQAAPWQQLANAGFNPRRLVFRIPPDAGNLPGALNQRRPGDGVVAYVCKGHVCGLPVEDLAAFAGALADPREQR